METDYTKFIESIAVLLFFFAIRLIVNQVIRRNVLKKLIQPSRTRLVRRAIHGISLMVCMLILLIIWGVKQSDLVVFIGSVLTVVGVAMFAQWSLLSNITASIIIFFYHSIRVGDFIAIMETKDYEIQGEIIAIGLFFTTLKTSQKQEEMTLPNNIFILKSIRKVAAEDPNDVV